MFPGEIKLAAVFAVLEFLEGLRATTDFNGLVVLDPAGTSLACGRGDVARTAVFVTHQLVVVRSAADPEVVRRLLAVQVIGRIVEALGYRGGSRWWHREAVGVSSCFAIVVGDDSLEL